jgi:hypothetical protein
MMDVLREIPRDSMYWFNYSQVFILKHPNCIHKYIQNLCSTVDSRLFAVMVGRIGADNHNQRINRSTHTQARYTGIKLTGA